MNAISRHYYASSISVEPGRLGPSGHTAFGSSPLCGGKTRCIASERLTTEARMVSQLFSAERREKVRYAASDLTQRVPSWYMTKTPRSKNITFGPKPGYGVGPRVCNEQTERGSPLISLGESSGSADIGGIATGSSVEVGSTTPRTRTTTRLNGEGSEKKKFRFESAPHIIPDSWFLVFSEGASFLRSRPKNNLGKSYKAVRSARSSLGRGGTRR